MSFMLPRLVSAHILLKDSGVIAISIDDYEFPYLKILMDTIFGEDNFIGNVVVCRSKNGKGSNKNIASSHEYLVVYGKTNSAQLRGGPDSIDDYDREDSFGKYRIDGMFRKKGQASLKIDRPNLHYPIYIKKTGEISLSPTEGYLEVLPVDSSGVERRWVWSKETAQNRIWQLYAGPTGTIYIKNYYSVGKRKKIRTLWNKKEYYTEKGTIELKKIFGERVFETPKPIEYIKAIIDQMSQADDIIIDFFAGTGTTAQAVKEINENEAGCRKVILMESNDKINKSHPAHLKGYLRICDITKRRLEYIKEVNLDYSINIIEDIKNHEVLEN